MLKKIHPKVSKFTIKYLYALSNDIREEIFGKVVFFLLLHCDVGDEPITSLHRTRRGGNTVKVDKLFMLKKNNTSNK